MYINKSFYSPFSSNNSDVPKVHLYDICDFHDYCEYCKFFDSFHRLYFCNYWNISIPASKIIQNITATNIRYGGNTNDT